MARPAKNLTYIRAVLDGGPLLASRIIQLLQQVHGLTRHAAARALERAKDSDAVYSSIPVSFGANDYLYWLPGEHLSPRYFSAVAENLRERPALHSAVEILLSFGGTLPLSFLRKFISAPQSVRFGKPTASDALRDLELLRIIGPPTDTAQGSVISLSQPFSDLFPPPLPETTLGVKLRSEGILLKTIARWLQATGFVAWNSVEVRNSQNGYPTIFNGFGFDLKAPSYLRPLATVQAVITSSPVRGKVVPGFLLADVSVGEFTGIEASIFLRKISAVRSRPNARPILGMCFATRFSAEAFSSLRSGGVSAVRLDRLENQSLPVLVTAIAQIYERVQNAKDGIDFERAINAVEKISGEREGNMAGGLWQFMVADHLAKEGWLVREFERGVNGILQSGKPVAREVDIVAEKDGVLHLVEVKGYHEFQPVELDEVKRFISETAPVAKKQLLTLNWFQTAKFSFFTSSYFKAEARVFLEEARERFRNTAVEIDFWDRDRLLDCWNMPRLQHLRVHLLRYFVTRKKVVYDPALDTVVATPVPDGEAFIGSMPEPTETCDPETALLEPYGGVQS